MRTKSPSPSAISVMGKRVAGRPRDERLPPRLVQNASDQTDALSMSMLRLADDEIERVWVSKTTVEKELRLSLVAKEAEVRKLKQNLAASEAAVEALNKTVAELQQGFLTLRAAADDSDVAVVVKKLKAELLAKHTEVRQASFERDDALSQVAKLTKSWEEAMAQRDRLQADLEFTRRTVDLRLPELESANAAYLADKAELQAALTSMNAEIDSLRSTEAQLTAEITAAQLKLKNRAKLAFDQELTAGLAASKAVVSAKSSELEKANKTIKYLESELTNLKTENLGYFEAEKTRLERKVAELVRLYEEEAARGLVNIDKANKTDALEAELKRANEVFDKTVADFQQQVSDLKTELEQMKATNIALTAKCTKLEEYERIFQSSELHSVLRSLSDVSSNRRRP